MIWMATWRRPSGSRRNSWEVREGSRDGKVGVKSERKDGEIKSRLLQAWESEIYKLQFTHSEVKAPVSRESLSTFSKNRDNLPFLAACETENAPRLMLTLSALWSHDTAVYSSTPTTCAPQVSWTVVGGVIQRRAGKIAPLIRLSCAEQTSVSNTGERGYCYCKQDSRLTAGEHTGMHHPS